jgi:hypothetical protein
MTGITSIRTALTSAVHRHSERHQQKHNNNNHNNDNNDDSDYHQHHHSGKYIPSYIHTNIPSRESEPSLLLFPGAAAAAAGTLAERGSTSLSSSTESYTSSTSTTSSTLLSPPLLSDLYHNPYEPMSFVTKSTKSNDTITIGIGAAPSNYTPGQTTSTKTTDSNYQSPTSVFQVPNTVVTPSSAETSTTISSTSQSYSTVASPMVVVSDTTTTNTTPIKMRYLPQVGSTSASSGNCPKRTSSSSKYGGAPWRVDHQIIMSISDDDDDEHTGPSSHRGGIIETHNFNTPSPAKRHPSSLLFPGDDAVVTPQDQVVVQVHSPPTNATQRQQQASSSPSSSSQTLTAAVDSMARLQELEQKRHALRHQRFTLEQRLYDFCGGASSKQQRLREEEEITANKETAEQENLEQKQASPKRALLWQGKGKKPKQADKATATETTAAVSPATAEGKMVVNWTYTTDAYTTFSSDKKKKTTKKTVEVMYTGRLNAKGQPHGDDASFQFGDGQVYTGSVRYGLRSGYGHNTWPDGQEYKGEWLNNSRNGRGTHIWSDGRRVSGEWKNGHLHGKIYFSWPNGATFDGTANMGKKEGRGMCEKNTCVFWFFWFGGFIRFDRMKYLIV